MKEWEIICIGDLCADLLVPFDPREKIQYRCGGSVGNTVQVLGKMNQKPVFITPVGNDQNGGYLKRQLEACHVNMDESFVMEKGNMYCIARLDQQGERTMSAWVPPWGGLPVFKETQFSRKLYEKPAILFTSGMILNNEPGSGEAVLSFLEAMAGHGSTIVFDLNARPATYGFNRKRKELFMRALACANVITGSGMEEFALVTEAENLEEGALRLYAPGKCIIARDGANPMVLQWDKGRQIIPVERVKVFNTVGAGDTFNAAFLAAFRKELPVESCASFASMVASYMISHKGHLEIPANAEKLLDGRTDL